MNVLPDVYNYSHRKKSAPLLPEGTVKCIYTSVSIQNSQRMQTEINESVTIAKVGFKSKMILSNIKGIQDSFQRNKNFNSYPNLIMFQLSVYSENRYTVYRSVVLKNNTLGTVFINKIQFLLFLFFSDIQNLLKCITYSIVWFHVIPYISLEPIIPYFRLEMVSPPLSLQWEKGR